MQAILKFKLPEEAEEHKNALNGVDYKIALDEMDNYLRGQIKYGELDEGIRAALQEARDHLCSLTLDIT